MSLEFGARSQTSQSEVQQPIPSMLISWERGSQKKAHEAIRPQAKAPQTVLVSFLFSVWSIYECT